MDEADELGDMIGIMDSGKMRTIGSSAFLKKRFGCGYILECEAKSETSYRLDDVVKFVTENLKGAKLNAKESFINIDNDSLPTIFKIAQQ